MLKQHQMEDNRFAWNKSIAVVWKWNITAVILGANSLFPFAFPLFAHGKERKTAAMPQIELTFGLYRPPQPALLLIPHEEETAKRPASNTVLAILHLTQSSSSGSCAHGDGRSFFSLSNNLIHRQPGQGTADEIGDRERLKEELRKAEQEYYENKEKQEGDGQQKMITGGEGGISGDADAKRQKLLEEAEKMAALDRDTSDSESDSGGSSR